ncbi:MAG: HAD hydrolase family protein [Solobacterium sp.]|nr:HAD hydrolase family protein [Solobacterium sp.]
MRKVFASDFDGTLYFYKAEDKLPQANVDKVKEYQAAGHLFGLCTGRQVGGLTPFIGGIIEPDFYITSSGSNIIDRHFNKIYQRGVDPKVADALVKELQPKGFRITLDVGGEICVFKEMDYPGHYYVIRGVDDLPEGLIHQVSVHTEDLKDAEYYAKWVNDHFGDDVEAFQNVIEIDIAPKGCSKGKGVGILREFLHEKIGDYRLYGIGDSINDLPLLEASDISYTFPYAPKIVQDRADFVVETIVDALEHSMKDPV